MIKFYQAPVMSLASATGSGGEDILPVACLCDGKGLQTHFLHFVGADGATEDYSRRVALTWAQQSPSRNRRHFYF